MASKFKAPKTSKGDLQALLRQVNSETIDRASAAAERKRNIYGQMYRDEFGMPSYKSGRAATYL